MNATNIVEEIVFTYSKLLHDLLFTRIDESMIESIDCKHTRMLNYALRSSTSPTCKRALFVEVPEMKEICGACVNKDILGFESINARKFIEINDNMSLFMRRKYIHAINEVQIIISELTANFERQFAIILRTDSILDALKLKGAMPVKFALYSNQINDIVSQIFHSSPIIVDALRELQKKENNYKLYGDPAAQPITTGLTETEEEYNNLYELAVTDARMQQSAMLRDSQNAQQSQYQPIRTSNDGYHFFVFFIIMIAIVLIYNQWSYSNIAVL